MRPSFVLLFTFLSLTAQAACGGSSGGHVTVIGTAPLAQDLSSSKSAHDSIFTDFRAEAARLGDLGHSIFVDAASPTDVAFVDAWSSKEGFMAFGAEPDVMARDGKLFAGPPAVSVVSLRSGWTMWGEFSRETPDGHPVNMALIRGKLAAGEDKSRAVHNQGAAQAESQARESGDVAHQVYLDSDDPSQFIVIDLWTSLDGAQNLYGTPSFQASFAQLLSGPPSVTLYTGTDWAQW
jgi:quinol monooxygenase YgiN